MRTLPLFSSVAQMPSGVVGADAGAAATGAGCGAGATATGAGITGATSFTTGAGVDVAIVVGAGGALFTTGAGTGGVAACTGAGAGAGELLVVSSSSFDLKPLNPLRLMPDRPWPEILMQDSWSQFFGASMWIFFPSISKETELRAWAAVLAIRNAAMM